MGYVGKVDLKKVDLVGQEQDDWVRPAEWPHIDPPIPGTQRMQGVYAVFDLPDDEGRTCRILCEGDYTVDWGDGTIENVASGVEAVHTYDYSSPALTPTSYGYKCAVVTVTPQVGQNMTLLDLRRFGPKHSNSCIPWLDISVNGAYLGSLTISSTTSGGLLLLERARIGENVINSFDFMFAYCVCLQDVQIADVSHTTRFNYMFRSCHSLRRPPQIAFPPGANLYRMFYGSYAMLDNVEYDLSGCSAVGAMFEDACVEGKISVNLSSVSSLSDFLKDNRTVRCFYATNTSSVTNINNMCYACNALIEIGPMDFSAVTSATNAFYGCYSLQRMRATGLSISFSLAGCNLGAEALNEVFSNLATVIGGQTITVTGNYGVNEPGYDPSIATAKGWTVIDT